MTPTLHIMPKRHSLIATTVAGLAINFAPSGAHAETEEDLVHLTTRVLSPLDGSWLNAGAVDVRGEVAAWEMPLTLQCRSHGAEQWYEAFTRQPEYDGSRENPKRVDSHGWAWYNWSYLVGFYPDGAIVNDGDQRASAIDCRFGSYVNNAFVPYTHFGQDGQQCLNDNPDDTLIQAYSRCAVAKDSITVFVRCGKAGQSCCSGADNVCDGDLGCQDSTCREKPKNDPPPPQQPPPQQPPPPPPPPPTPRGVFYEGLCECTDGFSWLNIGARACGDASGGPLDGFTLNAACARFCEQVGGTLTQSKLLGPQPQLGSCDPSDGTWYPVPL